MVTQALAQEISELEADFCFALSDPTRLLMIYALGEAPRNVTELAAEARRRATHGFAAPEDPARPGSGSHRSAGNHGHVSPG